MNEECEYNRSNIHIWNADNINLDYCYILEDNKIMCEKCKLFQDIAIKNYRINNG